MKVTVRVAVGVRVGVLVGVFVAVLVGVSVGVLVSWALATETVKKMTGTTKNILGTRMFISFFRTS